MEFNLKEFAGTELKKYKVQREIEGNLDNPDGKIEEFELEMLVYKASLKNIDRNTNDGGRNTGELSGKILKKFNLELEDIVIVENYKFRVTEILPRIYADFSEFKLELMRNGK